MDEDNIYHGLNFEDKSRTSFFNLTVGSTEADAERLAGNIMMSVGASLLVVPGLNLAGAVLIGAGFIISCDSNGVFTDFWNGTRLAETSIDFVTSAIPYGSIFGYLKKASMVGSLFTKFANKLDSIGGVLFDHVDLIGGGIKAAYTMFAETFFMDGSKSVPEIIVDSFINFVPTKLFTKTFADFPYAIGKWLVPISKEADDYQSKIIKAIYDYDTLVEILSGRVPSRVIDSIYTIKTIIGITNNEVLFHYGIFCNVTITMLINLFDNLWRGGLSLIPPIDFDMEYVAMYNENNYYSNNNYF